MDQGPVVIGGVGGSGTRLFAALLDGLGFYLGDDLNAAHDNLWFTLLFKRRELWPASAHQDELTECARIFRALMVDGSLPDDVNPEQIRLLARDPRPQHPSEWLADRAESILTLNNPARAGRWGFKEPNSYIFLPALAEALGSLKYIHVMRHGVDMAFSKNQNQLEFWGSQVLGRPVDRNSPSDSLAYWCAVHRRIEQLGAQLGERFLLLNYDEFCRSPAEPLADFQGFLEIDDTSTLDQLLTSHVRPRSLDRRKGRDLSAFSAADLDYVESMGFEI